ncbi:hypothetical protein RZS08_40675, partial [Arthrospira platensis SPKY1]|nr:hypothetical protein [Arthrospira platensis SPKY1]
CEDVHRPVSVLYDASGVGHVIIGSWLSTTTTLNVHWAVRPLASVAIAVTTVVPTGNAYGNVISTAGDPT